jgi:hypothetical protein
MRGLPAFLTRFAVGRMQSAAENLIESSAGTDLMAAAIVLSLVLRKRGQMVRSAADPQNP